MVMRRFALLLAPLLVVSAALTGCGSSTGSSGSSSSSSSNSNVSVTGAFGSQPKVTIPKATAGSSLHVQTVIAGHGPALPSTDALLGNYSVYIWHGSTSKMAQSTYDKVPALFAGHLLPGLTSALKNVKEGSRVLAVIPPKYGYGPQGNSQAGVAPTDTLVFVIDVIKGFPNNASVSGKSVSSGGHGLPTVTSGNPPTVSIPKSGKPPSSLVSKTLIHGTGPAIGKGDFVVAQYVGVIWRTGKIFDASERDGAPFGFQIGTNPPQVIPGWSDGLVGQKVGSRVMLVIPPKDGYGSQGSSQAGIKGTDTLVFVIDLLATYHPQTA
jgi:FKBP-type peptidyl-prolyl cis-trans isomerase